MAVKARALVLIGSATLLLHGCATMNSLGTDPITRYTSAEQLITENRLNDQDYVYAWGRANQQAEPQSLIPRAQLAKYCHAKGGHFSLLHKSNLAYIKNSKTKASLANEPNVKQAIGAYQCKHTNSWIVSIEPTADIRSAQYADARAIRLNLQLMSANEAKQFYKNSASSVLNTKKSTSVASKVAPTKAPLAKEQKDVIEKKETVAVEPIQATRVESSQQQQMKLYVSARRDINSGKNLNNACNNAQLAYNYGKQQGTDGTRIYTESGMLVARCLTSISSYNSRFPNAKGQAKRVLQNLATNYNHAGAKHMLSQM